MLGGPPVAPTPVLLVLAGSGEDPPENIPLRMGHSIASQRKRTLLIQTTPSRPATSPPPTPSPIASHLWRVVCDPSLATVAKDLWLPDFEAILVCGHGQDWFLDWQEQATHALLLLPGGTAPEAWDRLSALSRSMPIGCMVMRAGATARDTYDRLAARMEHEGHRPIQWLGAIPSERGDWYRAYRRLTRRSATGD